MKTTLTLALTTLALAACAESPDVATGASALAAEDVDVAPACAGIMTYVDGATVAELDSYLPATVANAIVARRNVTPFVDLADLSSVSGVAQARLVQIANRARTLGFIDATCEGVYEEHAVSSSDRVAMLAFVNGASESTLLNAVPTNLDVVPYLLAGRPYTTLTALADTPQVGIATFHSLRNAAIDGPFEVLAAAVNALGGDFISRIWTDFYWYDVLFGQDQPGNLTSMTCFGIDPALIGWFGGEIRPNLADADEVVAWVTDAVEYADARGALVLDQTAGLADLAAWADGKTFFGCYIGYAPNPWSGITRAFFVDTVSKRGVMAQTQWSE